MTKTKILIIMVFMFALGVNAIAASSVVTGNEPEPPKVVIAEGDRMTLEITGSYRVPVFTFLDQDFDYKENFKEVSILFEASGMSDWYKNFGKAYERRNNIQDSEDYLSISVKRFNNFLAQSQANRDKIAELIKAKLPPKWEKIQKTQEKARNTKLLFLNATVAVNLTSPVSSGDFAVVTMPGIRISYYFLNPLSQINFGIMAQFSYLSYGEKYAEAEYIEAALLCGLKFKFSSVSNFNLNIGLSLLNRQSYKIPTFQQMEFQKTVLGVSVDVGYMFITRNQKFTFFVNFNLLSANFARTNLGIRFGLGFNLL